MAVAALALVGVGVGAGWTGHAWQQRGGDADLSRIAHRVGAAAQATAADKIVVHVSSSAPDRVSEMLDDVEGLLRAARDTNRPIAIEILANNTGLTFCARMFPDRPRASRQCARRTSPRRLPTDDRAASRARHCRATARNGRCDDSTRS
jgi:hypothetical protein